MLRLCPLPPPQPRSQRRHLPMASRSRRLPCSGGMAYLQEKGGTLEARSCGHHTFQGPRGYSQGLRETEQNWVR